MIQPSQKRVLLEMAIASLDDAIAAQTQGADRLEQQVVKKTGCAQVHASLRQVGGGSGGTEPRELFRGKGTKTDARAVAEMRRVLDG